MRIAIRPYLAHRAVVLLIDNSDLRADLLIMTFAVCPMSMPLALFESVGVIGERMLAMRLRDSYSGRNVRQAVPASVPGAAAMLAHTRLALVPVIVNAPGTTKRLPHGSCVGASG